MKEVGFFGVDTDIKLHWKVRAPFMPLHLPLLPHTDNDSENAVIFGLVFYPYWLAFLILEGAVHVTGGANQSPVLPNLNPMSCTLISSTQ